MDPDGLLRYWEECHHQLDDDLRSRFLRKREVLRLLALPNRVVMEVVSEHRRLHDALEAAEKAVMGLAEKRAKGVHQKSEELNRISDETGTYRCVACGVWFPLYEFEYQYDRQTNVARRCTECRGKRRRITW